VDIEKLLNIKLPIVLASASPRRKKLMEQIGLGFDIIVSNFNEDGHPTDLNPPDYAMRLAYFKAMDVVEKISEPSIIIGADTIVVLDGEILNKPADEAEAAKMLGKLSGRTHTVFTGLALINTKTGKTINRVQNTDVTFRDLSIDEIDSYVATGSPLDKAGAYGIQDDFGAVFINHIDGCYYNIVGLPLEMLYMSLKEICM
jgi:septum formation protein